MFGSGWVAAEDRGLLLKMAVGPSFAATLDIPGINPFGLLLSGREFTPTFKDLLPPQLQVPHLTATNAIAGFALIGSIFGNGGGNEVANSNFLAGHPLAVMGPQLGYFYPEIVMQADLHGGGVDAQGVVAPISPYVFIGRGRDFAWSLTSAGSENTQQFLEQLCNPDSTPPTTESTHYLHDSKRIAMTTFDAGPLSEGNGEPARELTFMETVHGPVSGTVTVGGRPYAIAKERSTRGREPAGELAFSDLDSNRVHSPTQFFEAANDLETTFNQVLEGGPPPSRLAREAANLVTTWAQNGASRYGVTGPEDPGAAVLDQTWRPIGEAVLGPVLGPELTSEFASIDSPDNAPSASGPAYGGGWYGYVNKDLRTELNQPVEARYSTRYCGHGNLKRCRSSLWAVIQTAAEQLEKSQGSVPSNWRAARVRIAFPPLPKELFPFTMAWTNRSTFQQVIEFTGHGPTE